MDVKSTIRAGDVDALRQLVTDDPEAADRLISWGGEREIRTHPLHYISDMVFDGTLAQEKAVLLARVLIDAGAEIDYQRDGKGDTPLIGAASLGAGDVGLLLLEAGAKPEIRGLFGETALHWAAMLGEDRLVQRLSEGVDWDVEDSEYHSTPLGWALHGWEDAPAGSVGRQAEAIVLLVAAGAKVKPEWLESERVRGAANVLAALSATVGANT